MHLGFQPTRAGEVMGAAAAAVVFHRSSCCRKQGKPYAQHQDLSAEQNEASPVGEVCGCIVGTVFNHRR